MDSPRFALPLLAAAQAQKEVTHNEALLTIDRLLHPVVVSRAVVTPPAVAVAGQAWIVPPGATGAWAGQTDLLACHDGFGWQFVAPTTGLTVYLADEASFAIYAEAWSLLWPVGGLAIAGRIVLAAVPAVVPAPSGGAVIDVESRICLSGLIAALRAQGVLG